MLKSLLKKILGHLGLYEKVSNLWIKLQPKIDRPMRLLIFRDQRTIAGHLAHGGPKKLHIGCGPHNLEGWLNADLFPRGGQIALNATKRFPFKDDTLDFIYTEHMIEHIPWIDALNMLKETHRALKPGGVVRVVTPNMDFLTVLLQREPPESAKAYLQYNREIMTPWAPASDGIYLFNHMMRSWGHQFIFDAPSLRCILELAGFTQIVQPPLTESSHPELRGIAAESRMPPGFLALESLVMEGVKAS